MRTVLYDRHVALEAKMISFAGWEMPVQYKGIIAEHQAVRLAAGLFDVSHMGRINIEGPDAERFLDYLSTNKIAGKESGSAIYTVLCHENGMSVDDVIIYKQDDTHFFLIANASNRQKDLNHLVAHATDFHVNIKDCFEGQGILALQGPLAEKILVNFFPFISEIKPMHFRVIEDEGYPLVISHTGYTGAGGFELYGSNQLMLKYWDQFLAKGGIHGLQPVGLGARDTLRLEMGFALYGHELNDQIAPTESVSAWTVKWHKGDFLGKQALEKLENSSQKRAQYGIKLIDRGIAREGYPVFFNQQVVGNVTSGSFSPTLNQSIALILVNVPLKEGDKVQVQIRDNFCEAEVVSLPFIRKSR